MNKTVFGLGALAILAATATGLWFLAKSGEVIDENWDEWLNLVGYFPV